METMPRESIDPKAGNDFFDFLHRAAPVMLAAFLFLNPFPHTTAIKEILFYLTILAAVILLVSGHKEYQYKTALLYPYCIFFIWAVCSCFFALEKGESLHDLYAHLAKYGILYLLLINFIRTRKQLLGIFWVVVVSGALFSAGSLIHFYLVEGNPLTMRFGLYFENSANAIMGFITVFALILTVQKLMVEKHPAYRTFLYAAAPFLFAASIMTQSRSTVLALMAAFIVMFSRNKKVLVTAIIILALFIGLTPLKERAFTDQQGSYSVRLGLLYYSLEIAKDFPVIGTGFAIDTFRNPELIDSDKYLQRIPEQYRNPPHPYLWPHNMLISMAVRIGFPGTLLFIYLLLVPVGMSVQLMRKGGDDFIRNWGRALFAVLLMCYIKGMFEPIFIHFVDTTIYSVWALITILWYEQNLLLSRKADLNRG